MKKWELLSSTYIFQDRWLTMRSDSYRTPAGNIIEPYYIRELTNWVGCLTVDAELNVIMLDHYRPGANAFLREIPAGLIEADDVSPRAAVLRELEEEVGYSGGELFEIGGYWSNPAIQTNRVYSFIALGGTSSRQTQHDEGETMRTYKTSLPELLSDISQPSDIPRYQGLHLAIIFQAIQFINQSNHPDAIKLRAQLQ